MSLLAPCDPAETQAFLDGYLYDEEAFMVDEVLELDAESYRVVARTDTRRVMPYTRLQRASERHPAHVSAGDLLTLTGNLGFLHAWFFHGCRWDDGWVGFGNRVHRADFKALTRLGPPLELVSTERRRRIGERRVVIRFEFHFTQEDKLVYYGDQSAMFFRELPAGAGA